MTTSKKKCYLYFDIDTPNDVYLTTNPTIKGKAKNSSHTIVFDNIKYIDIGKKSLIANSEVNVIEVATNTTELEFRQQLIDAYYNADPDSDGYKDLRDDFWSFSGIFKEVDYGSDTVIIDEYDEFVASSIEEYLDYLLYEFIPNSRVDGDSGYQYRWYKNSDISELTVFDDDF